jgi:WD40 repeat protein
MEAVLVAAIEAAAGEPGTPVLVTGPGGFGKTTLVACVWDQVRHLFPDGVLWVELGQQPGDQKLADILIDQVTNLTGVRQEYRTVSGAADALAAALGEQRILLVVDNAWREADIEPFLRGGSRCIRVVTARRRLAGSGPEVLVGPMMSAEAASLLLGAAPSATDEEVRPLLDRCGRWPLALALLSGTLSSLCERMPVAEAVGVLLGELDRSGASVLDDLADVGPGRGVGVSLTLSLNELEATSPHGHESLLRYATLAAFPADTPVPYRLLERLWGLTAAHAQSECIRFRNRSLLVRATADGVQVHTVIHDQLRHAFGAYLDDASSTLLEASRPTGGWHALPPDDPLCNQLAHHLLQSGSAELGELLRDFRYLLARLEHHGPLALESDLQTYLAACPGDGSADAVRKILRQDAHMLVGHDDASDLALTLYSRLLSHGADLAQLTHLQQTLPATGLIPDHMPDRASSRLLREFAGHGSSGCALAWHAGSGLLLSVDRDGTLARWDPASGARTSAVHISSDPVVRGQLSPDGRHLAIVCRAPTTAGEAKVQVTSAGESLPHTEITQTWIKVVDLATDATVAAHLVDWTTRNPAFADEPLNVSWSPNSTTVAFPKNNTVQLWSFQDSRDPTVLTATARWSDRVGPVAWHPTAGLACTTEELVVWWPRPASDTEPQTWQAPDPFVLRRPNMLAWRPDGRRLATSSCGELLILDPAERRLVARHQTGLWPAGLSWSADGSTLACICGGRESQVAVWREEPAEYIVLDSAGGQFHDLAWHPHAAQVAVATWTPTIRIYRTTPTAAETPNDPALPTQACWQPHGDLMAVARHTFVRVVSADAPDTPVGWIEPDWTAPVAWSPDGRFLVDHISDRAGEAAARVRLIRVRDAADGTVIRTLPTESGYGEYAVFAWPTPQSFLATRSYYEDIVLIDAATAQKAQVVTRSPQDETIDVAVSPDGQQLAICHRLDGLAVIDLASNERIVIDADARYMSVCFAGIDHLLALTVDREIVLWNLLTQTAVIRRHQARLDRIAADPTGRYAATVTASGRVTLLHAATLERICRIAINGTALGCEFDSTGRRLAVVGSAGIYVFQIQSTSPRPINGT